MDIQITFTTCVFGLSYKILITCCDEFKCSLNERGKREIRCLEITVSDVLHLKEPQAITPRMLRQSNPSSPPVQSVILQLRKQVAVDEGLWQKALSLQPTVLIKEKFNYSHAHARKPRLKQIQSCL